MTNVFSVGLSIFKKKTWTIGFDNKLYYFRRLSVS